MHEGVAALDTTLTTSTLLQDNCSAKSENVSDNSHNTHQQNTVNRTRRDTNNPRLHNNNTASKRTKVYNQLEFINSIDPSEINITLYDIRNMGRYIEQVFPDNYHTDSNIEN